MLKHIVRNGVLSIKATRLLSAHSAVKRLTIDRQEGGTPVVSCGEPAAQLRKWQWPLVSLGVLLIIMIIIGLVRSEIEHSATPQMTSPVRDNFEKSLVWVDPHGTDPDLRFDESARATEAGFNAAFPFHR